MVSLVNKGKTKYYGYWSGWVTCTHKYEISDRKWQLNRRNTSIRYKQILTHKQQTLAARETELSSTVVATSIYS